MKNANKNQIKEAIEALEFFISGECTGNQGDFIGEISLAIEALGKQIPKKPIGRHTDYKCAVCGRRVRSGKGSSSHVRDNFCQRCGTALDWEEGSKP